MHFAYWAYYLLIGLPPLALMLLGRTAALRDLVFRLMLTYLTCYAIYLVYPVYGPGLTLPRYAGPLNDGLFHRLVASALGAGDSPGSAFPSSHVAGAVTIAYACSRWLPRRIATLLWLEAIGVLVSTVYTQNHFPVDALAGWAGGRAVPIPVVAAVRGAETVLHLAACARAWARDPAEFTAVNVHTVERLLESAHAAGVSRLVHVSTMLTLPPGRPAPLDGLAARPTPYEESKRAGERLVESYAAAGRHAVIVHPTRVYGSGPCNDANAVTRVIALYLRGRFRVRLDDGDVLASYVHAADVADGIRGAARAEREILGREAQSGRPASGGR